MNPRYLAVARRAAHRCEYCRAPEAAFNFPFEVEHVIPISRNGSNLNDNLALACRACNLRKSDVISGHDEVTKQEVSIFHPRTNRWPDHFVFDPDTGTVIGITPVGRVTVGLLDLNHSLQIAARELWCRLRLYP